MAGMSQPCPDAYVVGVDVGSSSTRVGIVHAASGEIVASHSHPIRIFNPAPNVFQHSSADIWQAVCTALRTALRTASAARPGLTAAAVRGIAFDATCSLVVLGPDGAGLTVSPGGEKDQDVIVWMDHRAEEETRAINATGHEVLRYVGSRMSVEMELPKLLWLKKHIPSTYRDAAHFMDLADFLSFKATGMVPGMWLLEGGQSATGALLDHVIDSHVLGPQLRQQAAERGVAASSIIHDELLKLQQQQLSLCSFHLLTASMHVLPYHHGNRSPRADSSLLGACSGLTLSHSMHSLALLYLATLQAIAYGTRHIVETIRTSTSAPITGVWLCGGLSRSALFTETMADVLGMEVRLKAGGAVGQDSDAMLLGSAMIAASACGLWPGLREAMRGMCGDERVVVGAGRDTELGRYHDRKYRVFLQMYDDQMRYRHLMTHP